MGVSNAFECWIKNVQTTDTTKQPSDLQLSEFSTLLVKLGCQLVNEQMKLGKSHLLLGGGAGYIFMW